ncbi:MAG: hypothetical protein LBG98_00640 [Puniceicoccales bacterium]|nr:hypothetical protein [Puniceicoccales bacterium]
MKAPALYFSLTAKAASHWPVLSLCKEGILVTHWGGSLSRASMEIYELYCDVCVDLRRSRVRNALEGDH